MAQKIVTTYIDDLTGEESSEAATHVFSLDGISYEIDLGPDSYDSLLEALAPFTKVGRKSGNARKSVSRAGRSRNVEDSTTIRAWAKANGFSVNDRGRVPADIREAYAKATK